VNAERRRTVLPGGLGLARPEEVEREGAALALGGDGETRRFGGCAVGFGRGREIGGGGLGPGDRVGQIT
jgi:hypothetical protein